MTQRYTEQLVVRVTPEVRIALEADASANERTVAQSIRRALRRYIADEVAGMNVTVAVEASPQAESAVAQIVADAVNGPTRPRDVTPIPKRS